MRGRKTSAAGASAAGRYLEKAEEYLAAAQSALVHHQWNAASLGSVHAGISFADAVLAHAAGIRCRETDHGAIVSLLDERVAQFRGGSRRQLVGLLSNKNTVEYEDRPMTEVEARQMVDSAGRFGSWARGICGRGG